MSTYPSIISKDSLIITAVGIIVSELAKVQSYEIQTIITVNGDVEIFRTFNRLCESTVSGLKDVTDSKQGCKLYEIFYKQWSQFRREYRHSVFVVIDRNHSITVVDIDNLYLDKKTVGSDKVLWKHGVTSVSAYDLLTWNPPPPPGWNSFTWGDLLHKRVVARLS